MRKGKVQTNEFNVNVLVEHEDCNGTHISHLDVDVLCEKMTDEDINIEFSKIELSINDKKDFLKKKKGFATSNVFSKKDNISYSDLFKYKKRN